MTTITPEQFMTMAEPDEDAFDPYAGREAFIAQAEVQMAPAVPDEVQHALRFILDRIKQQDVDTEALQTQREQLLDLEAKHAELYALLEEIEAIIKPSTSKLANSVRDAIKAWRDPEVPTVTVSGTLLSGSPIVVGDFSSWNPGSHPAHDAPVEAWREYASTVNASLDFSTMNRSQIRTALGIEQPAGAES
jgi:hypothetical protein